MVLRYVSLVVCCTILAEKKIVHLVVFFGVN